MKKYYSNESYNKIVSDILNNAEFLKLKQYKHHGDNRMDHCIRVSYYSYLIANKLKLDSTSVARAGLLHDFFFLNNQNITLSERIKVLIDHPKMAVDNAKSYFSLNKKEENIIVSHMFPIGLMLPTCFESVLVNMVDNVFSVYERILSTYKSISNHIYNFIDNVFLHKSKRKLAKVQNK